MSYLSMSKFHTGYTITMKDIVREGHPILRKRTREVNVPMSKQDQETLICMMNFLKNSQDPVLSKKYQLRAGVGLSANQIGLNKRMFTAYFVDEAGRQHEYVLANPEIISHSVWLYCRFALSFRDVEEMLAMRGVDLTYETVREWCLRPDVCQRLASKISSA